jgi:uncharacterized MAPEG superfamily protein
MVANYSYHLLGLTIIQGFFSSPRIIMARLGMNDNVNPRQALDTMERQGKWDKATIAKLRRRQAAHQNCLESLGPVCAAVVRADFLSGEGTGGFLC